MNILYLFIGVATLMIVGCNQTSESSSGYVLVVTDSAAYKYNSNGVTIKATIYNYTTDTLFTWNVDNKPAFILSDILYKEPIYSKFNTETLPNIFSFQSGRINSFVKYTDSATIVLMKGEYQISMLGGYTFVEIGTKRFTSKTFTIE